MAKKLVKLALRLLMLQIVSIFIMFFMIMPFAESNIYHWIITAFMTLVLFYFVWRDSESAGQKDIHADKIAKKRMEEGHAPSGLEGRLFRKWFGFAVGLSAQVPALALLVASFILKSQAWQPTLVWISKMWYITYYVLLFKDIFTPDATILIMFGCSVLFSVVAGLAYLNGPAVDRKIETIIERNKAKKPRLVQDEWKTEAKRKARQKKH